MRKLPKTLERQEVRLLLSSCPSHTTGRRNRLLLETIYGAGLRVSEACSLRKRHIRIASNIIEVLGKGEKERNVPIPDALCFALSQWLEESPMPGHYLFPTWQGRALSPRYVQRMAKALAIKAGIGDHVHPHMLRHTYATELLEEGFNLREVQELLGHSNVATTEVYTHVRPSRLREMISSRGT